MIIRQFLTEVAHPAALLYLFTKPAVSLPQRNENKSGRRKTKAKVFQGEDERRGGTRGAMENFEEEKVGQKKMKKLEKK